MPLISNSDTVSKCRNMTFVPLCKYKFPSLLFQSLIHSSGNSLKKSACNVSRNSGYVNRPSNPQLFGIVKCCVMTFIIAHVVLPERNAPDNRSSLALLSRHLACFDVNEIALTVAPFFLIRNVGSSVFNYYLDFID